MNGAEEKKRIRHMNIRYMFLSMLLYLGIYMILLCIYAVLNILLDFDPYVRLLLFLIFFVVDNYLTRACLHLPSLRKIIYDPGY